MDALLSQLSQNSTLLVLLVIWVLPWKGVALWKAAMREDKWWFIAIFILNTFALLDIYYIFFVANRDRGDELASGDESEMVEDSEKR